MTCLLVAPEQDMMSQAENNSTAVKRGVCYNMATLTAPLNQICPNFITS